MNAESDTSIAQRNMPQLPLEGRRHSEEKCERPSGG
jgi:hypothetical protein